MYTQWNTTRSLWPRRLIQKGLPCCQFNSWWVKQSRWENGRVCELWRTYRCDDGDPFKFAKQIHPKDSAKKQPMDFKEPLFSCNKKVNKNILFSTIMVENGYIWKVTNIGDTSIIHWTIFGGFGCLSNFLGNSLLSFSVRRLSDATDSSI